MGYIQEKHCDGKTLALPTVKLKNPTATAVKFVGKNALHREVTLLNPNRAKGAEPLVRSRSQELVIEAGETVEVSMEVANTLLQMRCVECEKPWRFGEPGPVRCVDPTHQRQVFSGLAPMLVVVDEETDEVVPVEVAGNLREAPSPVFDPADLHARTMARLGGRK